jgi:DNA topoisomerase I
MEIGLDLPFEDTCLESDPVEAAETAGLVYIADQQPGIRRESTGTGFNYYYPNGKKVSEDRDPRRIKALVIPPAWKEVWISPLPDSHLQATGRDARGRKQYRYHKSWAEVRGQTKFNRMVPFGMALSRIRKRVEKDLAIPGLARKRILATVVRLLETTLIRVGNEAYARENHSFGLTTLQTKHIDLDGSVIWFHFRGKSGQMHRIKVHDKRVSRVVAAVSNFPGMNFFSTWMVTGKRARSIREMSMNTCSKSAASVSRPKSFAPGEERFSRPVPWLNSENLPRQPMPRRRSYRQ